MMGMQHLIIVGFGMLGLLLGGVLIDLDHMSHMNIKCMKYGFFNNVSDDCKDPKHPLGGFFHNQMVMLSLMAFSLCLGIGLAFHYLQDLPRWLP